MESVDSQMWAHVDESFPQLSSGRFLYALATVITDADQRAAARQQLQYLAQRDKLTAVHFADENRVRRVVLAKQIAELELTGALVVSSTSAASKLEQCRSRLLATAAIIPTAP